MTERFDEIIDEAGVLRDLDAARAEVWASGVVAEWGDVPDLLARLRASARPEAVDLAGALVAIEPDAVEVVAALRAGGAPAPAAWVEHVGTARGEQAWEIVDPFSGNISIVIELAHADEVRHSMLVEIEEELAVDIHFGPPGLVDDAFDESDTRSLSVRELDVPSALERIAHALARTAAHHDPSVTDEYVMNLPLLAARLDSAGVVVADLARSPEAADAGVPTPTGGSPRERARDPEDAEADAAACATLRAALAKQLAFVERPPELLAVAGEVRAALARHDTPDLDALAEDAGVDAGAPVDDDHLLAALAGAFVVPGPLAAFAPQERDALRGLEWADWLGAVIPLVRDGVGGDASPEQLVRNINRCPEVTTTVPRRDIPLVAAIFARMLHAWELTGVVDAEGRLTAVGAWVLPRALLHAWGDRSPGHAAG